MNKKLIKSIVSVTCGLGVATSIPFVATSCGCSSVSPDKINPLPDTVYKYDATNNKKLLGFTDEFLVNQNKYKQYNTMLISTNVNDIAQEAFHGKIPLFITKIIFPAEMPEEIATGYGVFYNNSSITSIVLPGNLKTTYMGLFEDCSNLSSITWDAWDCSSFDGCFRGVAATGTVKVTNPIDSDYDSAALLTILKQSGELPSGWQVAED